LVYFFTVLVHCVKKNLAAPIGERVEDARGKKIEQKLNSMAGVEKLNSMAGVETAFNVF
jgi:hypothetical protein